MLQLTPYSLAALEGICNPVYKAKVYFQSPEIYTVEDYLQSIGPISSAMSKEGGYVVQNTIVILINRDFYFSRKFAKELPVKKLIEIFIVINSEEILIFSGIVSDSSQLDETTLTLPVNA
jgi:hypothetical protein